MEDRSVEDMAYYCDAEDVVPDVLHFGVASFRQAREPLAEHSHPGAIEIFYVESGMVRYVAENEEHEVHGGQVFIFFPDEVHGTGAFPEERTSFAWLSLRLHGQEGSFLGSSSEAALSLRRSLLTIDRRLFPGGGSQMAAMERAVEAFRSGLDYAPLILHASVVDFASAVLNDFRSCPGVALSREVVEAKLFIDANAGRRLALEEVANSIGMALPTLKRRFRKEVGMPPYEYLLRRKTELAAGLLRSSRMDIGSIAYRLGFSSSQHLSFAFRRWQGTSPSSYRTARGKG